MNKEAALVVGESLMDVIRHPAEAPVAHPDASTLNVAFGLGRLGQPSVLMTWLGDDEHGRTIRRYLDRSSVTLAEGAASGWLAQCQPG